MATKQALHHLVDELPEDKAELACVLLEDLRDAADVGGPPLDAETLASLDRGLADIASGRVKPLDEYSGAVAASSLPSPDCGARTGACHVGTRADAWAAVFSPTTGVETSLDTARMSACATNGVDDFC